MNIIVLLPAAVAVAAVLAGLLMPRHLRPSSAVWMLTISTSFAASALLLSLVQVAASGLSEFPVVSDALGWCRVLTAGQHGAPPIVGMAAMSALAMITVRIVRHQRRVRASVRRFEGITGLHLIEADRPLAFAVPGNPGGVVMSRSMLRSLDRREREVVLAHENAHLRHHHHVFVMIARLCAAGLPPLRPFARRIEFLTERWADEVAAERVGSRRAVADTIAKVALLPLSAVPASAHALALSGGDVVDRFAALEIPPPRPDRRIEVAALSVVVSTSVAAAVQLHHLLEFASHVH